MRAWKPSWEAATHLAPFPNSCPSVPLQEQIIKLLIGETFSIFPSQSTLQSRPALFWNAPSSLSPQVPPMCKVSSCSSCTSRSFCEIPSREGIPLGSVRWYCSLDTRKSEPVSLGVGYFSSGSYGSSWVIHTSFPCDFTRWAADWLIGRYSLWTTAKQGFSQWKGWVARAGSEKWSQAQGMLNRMHISFEKWHIYTTSSLFSPASPSRLMWPHG